MRLGCNHPPGFKSPILRFLSSGFTRTFIAGRPLLPIYPWHRARTMRARGRLLVWFLSHSLTCAAAQAAVMPADSGSGSPLTTTASRGAANTGGWPRNQLPLTRERSLRVKVTAPRGASGTLAGPGSAGPPGKRTAGSAGRCRESRAPATGRRSRRAVRPGDAPRADQRRRSWSRSWAGSRHSPSPPVCVETPGGPRPR